MKPIVSIIVPIYNVERYINKCIDSILSQTFKKFELILVDDGSPDSCGEMCDKYAKLDYRIKVIHKKNGGLSSARNAGIDIAQGKYIGFIDSDDWIKNDMYESLYKAIIKYDADISICDFIKFNENYDLSFKEDSRKNIEIWNNIEALEKLNTDNCGKIVIAWNKLYKKELWSDIRFPEGRIHEDVFTMHKILFKANRVVNTNKILYGYLQRSSSIIGTKFSLKKLDYIDGLRERINFYRKNNLKKLEEDTRVILCCSIRDYYCKLRNSNIENKEKYLKFLHALFNSNYMILKKSNITVSIKQNIVMKIFKYNPNLYVKLKNIL
ncbi:glycosyltransferase family 2 protein [Clostridium tyrobutyricum]|uniref:glycosyltransferase family 2 protein n=1 Tax=Clostridium tyrobutyricum TaxID=1519 RepID=UPI0020139AD7|nr:glycosyltransferase [Clostridium tyrobutyricum]MBR9647298.1 glycosyltransferase [Clostridium tyrobutyricum]